MFLYVEHTNQIRTLDLEDRDALIWILIDYMENRTEPSEEQLQSMSKPLRGMWGLIKKDVMNYDKDRENGKKGGRPKGKKQETGEEPTLNPGFDNSKPPLNSPLTQTEPWYNPPQTPPKQKEKENKKENIKEKDYVVATQQPVSSDIPDFISFNPRESPYVKNPPTVEEMVTYAQASCIPNFNAELAERMIDYYTSGGWTKKNGQVIRDWHPLIKQWASGETKQMTKEEEARARRNAILEAGFAEYEKKHGPNRACI